MTNAFGLQSKFSEFQHEVVSLDVDIAIVTETKFTEDKLAHADISIPGYADPFRLDRSAQGGGIGVWVKSTLAVKSIDTLDPGSHEVLWLSLHMAAGEDIVLGAVYRPGSSADNDISLLEYLDKTIDQARKLGTSIILTGDFNVHSESWLGSCKTTKAGDFLEDISTAHGLTQYVKEPTRGHNTLDLILTDFSGTVQTSTRAPIGRSDHSVVIAEFSSLTTHREDRCARPVWRYKHADWGRMRAFFRCTDWETIISEDPNKFCSNLTSHISLGMKKFIPCKTLLVRPTDPDWWTPECSKATSAKQKAWKRWQKHPQDLDLRHQFMTTVQDCVSTLHRSRLAKLQHLRHRLATGSLRDKAWWSCIKQAGGNNRRSDVPLLTDNQGKEHVTSKEKAECFGSFFAKKCSLGDNDLSPNQVPPLPPWTGPRLTSIHFRQANVRRRLSQLDPSKATGPDAIPARVLKECAAELALPVTKLFTLCFITGTQPTLWKIANVVPVHKRDSKSKLKNYRPVSLLCILSKVMESIVNTQVVSFLEKNNIISQYQFGFRSKLGTADLLTALHTEWLQSLANGGAVQVLAIDIAGAFDRVSHVGILAKAEAYGIQGLLLTWLTHYLSDRQIRAVVSGSTSASFPVKAGVPQGSILGPTLFLLYVNDAEKCLPTNASLAVYADDTTLYATIPSYSDIDQASSLLQKSLDSLDRWGRAWRVQFEPTKSQGMLLDHHRPSWPPPSLLFGGQPVSNTQKLKLLGVTFDAKLLYKEHIRNIARRANQRLNFLRRTVPILGPADRLTVYKGFVRPILEYACLVWMGAAPTHLSRLDAVQKRALKLVGPQVITDSLCYRRTVSALCYLFKLQCIAGPPQLLRMVPQLASLPDDAPRTRLQSHLSVRHTQQLCKQLPANAQDALRRSFPSGVIDTWNELPAHILPGPPSLKSLPTFKTNVAKHLRAENWVWATDYAA